MLFRVLSTDCLLNYTRRTWDTNKARKTDGKREREEKGEESSQAKK
jgi:hypothetical protein